MGIGKVVIPYSQTVCNIHILCPRHSRLHLRKHFPIVKGKVAILFRQIISFIRNNSSIDLTTAVFQVAVIDSLKLFDSAVNRVFIQRILYLCCMTVRYINLVVIPLPEHIVVGQGFELAETIPHGELIQRVFFKFCHKAAVQQRFSGNLRQLGKGSAFCKGILLFRTKP